MYAVFCPKHKTGNVTVMGYSDTFFFHHRKCRKIIYFKSNVQNINIEDKYLLYPGLTTGKYFISLQILQAWKSGNGIFAKKFTNLIEATITEYSKHIIVLQNENIYVSRKWLSVTTTTLFASIGIKLSLIMTLFFFLDERKILTLPHFKLHTDKT